MSFYYRRAALRCTRRQHVLSLRSSFSFSNTTVRLHTARRSCENTCYPSWDLPTPAIHTCLMNAIWLTLLSLWRCSSVIIFWNKLSSPLPRPLLLSSSARFLSDRKSLVSTRRSCTITIPVPANSDALASSMCFSFAILRMGEHFVKTVRTESDRVATTAVSVLLCGGRRSSLFHYAFVTVETQDTHVRAVVRVRSPV